MKESLFQLTMLEVHSLRSVAGVDGGGGELEECGQKREEYGKSGSRRQSSSIPSVGLFLGSRHDFLMGSTLAT